MNKHFPPGLVLTWCAFPPTGRRAGRAGGGRPAGGERLAAGGGGGSSRAGGSGYTNGLQLGKFWAKGGCDE